MAAVFIWLVLISLSTLCGSKCPTESLEHRYIDEDRVEWCVTMIPFTIRAETIRRSFTQAAYECEHLKAGSKGWRMPKANTKKKNAQMAAFLVHKGGLDAWVWLDLHRFGPEINGSHRTPEWISSQYWFWGEDNSPLTGMDTRILNGRWESAGVRVGEKCVIGRVGKVKNEVSLRWSSYPCESINDNRTVNMTMILCEIRGTPMFGWWFYVICGVLIVLAILAMIVACVMCRQHPPKGVRRKGRQKDERKKKAQDSVILRKFTLRRVLYGSPGKDQGKGESTKEPKMPTVTTAKSTWTTTKTGTGPGAGAGPGMDDSPSQLDSEGEYSNVTPYIRRSNTPSSSSGSSKKGQRVTICSIKKTGSGKSLAKMQSPEKKQKR